MTSLFRIKIVSSQPVGCPFNGLQSLITIQSFVLTGKLLELQLSRVVGYNRRAFIRLTTVHICD